MKCADLACFLILALPVVGSAAARRPLKPEQTQVIEKLLADRSCGCPCGQTLEECFGCSVAKSDLTLAVEGVRAGLDFESIRRRLDSPVTLTLWLDYVQPESRAACRIVAEFKERNQSHVKVVYRYLLLADSPLSRVAATAAECAREIDKFHIMHKMLYDCERITERAHVEGAARRGGIDPLLFGASIESDRYATQLDKDADAAVTQYEIPRGQSPAVFINDGLYDGPITVQDLEDTLIQVLFTESL